MATFGERVRERRLELRMGQPELARAAGIKQSTVSNIESGRNKGSKYVAELALALKCSAHWLATGRGKNDLEPRETTTPAARSPDARYSVQPTQSVDLELLQVVLQGVKEHFDDLDEDPTAAELSKWAIAMYERFAGGAAPDVGSVKSSVQRFLKLVSSR